VKITTEVVVGLFNNHAPRNASPQAFI